MPPAKERTPELRRRILDTALGVLAAEGVSAVTTRHVAKLAGTSPPAIYELFDHKAGLIRELFFEGFRRLLETLERLGSTGDPAADLAATVHAFRTFASDNPNLFNVMYNRPFDEYGPARDERSLGDDARRFVVDRVERCIQAGAMTGDPADIAHVLLGFVIGLATQENAGWLGSTAESRDRRWTLAVDTFLQGLPARSG
jgi:AcrR family transcriptional regulator